MILAADEALDASKFPQFATATRTSALIEHSGQCTALRHVIAPGAGSLTPAQLAATVFRPLNDAGAQDALSALEAKRFATLLSNATPVDEEKLFAEGYHYSKTTVEDASFVAWRVNAELDGSLAMDEHWRNVVVDVTAVASRAELLSPKYARKVAKWLCEKQPISCAVNTVATATAPDAKALAFARTVWERSSCVVFSVGTADTPALTAQARPQDGELFGEVPPRRHLDAHTTAAVVVPSSTPSYTATYADEYLAAFQTTALSPRVEAVVAACASPVAAGYCRVVTAHLREAAAAGPRRGVGARTCLWGLQRPPLGSKTLLRIGANCTFDAAAPALAAFVATNAYESLHVSIDPFNFDAIEKCKQVLGRPGFAVEDAAGFVTLDDESTFGAYVSEGTKSGMLWNLIHASEYDSGSKTASKDKDRYALEGHFLARLFVVGHVKSALGDDENFLDAFRPSPKWLTFRQGAR